VAKRVPPLTAAAIAKIKPDPAKTIEKIDGAVPGLRLRVTPNNTRTWSLNIRAKGVMRRFDVGSELGLAEAREKALAIRQRVKDGADPTAERRANRKQAVTAKQGIGTFGSAVDAYFLGGNGAGLKTKAEQSRRIKSVFRGQLMRPALEIKSVELQQAVDEHGASSSGARAVGYVTPMIKWATKRGLMQGSFDLEKPRQNAPKQRVLTIEELAALLPTFTDAYGRCCRFILLTGARQGEVKKAKWGQFDFTTHTWTIPAEVRKDTRAQKKRRIAPKQAMVVPLSQQAIEVLMDTREAELSRRQLEGSSREITDDDLVFVGQKGGSLGNWDRWLKANAQKSGVTDWSSHALRRTAATLAGEQGAAPHIVEVILGHSNVGGQLVAGYNKSRYRAEHTEALRKVGDLLDGLDSKLDKDAKEEVSGN